MNNLNNAFDDVTSILLVVSYCIMVISAIIMNIRCSLATSPIITNALLISGGVSLTVVILMMFEWLMIGN